MMRVAMVCDDDDLDMVYNYKDNNSTSTGGVHQNMAKQQRSQSDEQNW
jgi:hypothetical protein